MTALAVILAVPDPGNVANIVNPGSEKQMIEIETPNGYKTISIEAGQVFGPQKIFRIKGIK